MGSSRARHGSYVQLQRGARRRKLPTLHSTAQINVATAPLQALFDGGPPSRLQYGLRLMRPGQRCIVRRVAFVVLVVWLPLLVLGGDGFVNDLGAHARYLIAVPLLIVAESICTPQLGAIAQHFLDSKLVADEDRPRFEAVVLSTLRMRDALLAEIIVIMSAYMLVGLLIYAVPENALPTWLVSADGGFALAGWWNIFVSLPIMLTLLLGWLWRLALWSRFLWRVSRLNLRLIAVHPDRAGGLCFVDQSVRVFSILAFAISTIVAGSVASELVYRDVSPLAYKALLGILTVSNIALFTAPLFVFTPLLLRARQRGLFTYGSLALALGREFERAWMDRRQSQDERLLDTPAFSAATDLYQVVSNVYRMRIAPLEWQSLAVLVVAILLPAVVLVLATLPLKFVIERLVKLLF